MAQIRLQVPQRNIYFFFFFLNGQDVEMKFFFYLLVPCSQRVLGLIGPFCRAQSRCVGIHTGSTEALHLPVPILISILQTRCFTRKIPFVFLL